MRIAGRGLVVAVALGALGVGCKNNGPPVNAKKLAISMSFVRGENSKDSNSQHYAFTLTGDTVSYSGPHPPCARGRCAHGKTEFKLDKKVYDEALRAIARGALTTSFSETKKVGGLGNYVQVEATVTLDGKTGKSVINGMTYSREPAGELLSKQAQDRSEAVRMLLIPFRHAGEEHLPKK